MTGLHSDLRLLFRQKQLYIMYVEVLELFKMLISCLNPYDSSHFSHTDLGLEFTSQL